MRAMLSVLAALVLFVSAWSAHASPKARLNGVVNLNTASMSELELLPGVGVKAAQRIIAHRQKTPFRRVEELTRVKGFGLKKLAKLKPYLTVSGQTTLSKEASKPAPTAKAQARGAPPPR